MLPRASWSRPGPSILPPPRPATVSRGVAQPPQRSCTAPSRTDRGALERRRRSASSLPLRRRGGILWCHRILGAPWQSADSFLRGGPRRRARRRRAAAGGFPARVASRRSVASCGMVCHGVSVSLLVSGWGGSYRSREETDSLGTLGFHRTRARRCARIRVSASGPKRARPAWRLLVALVVVEKKMLYTSFTPARQLHGEDEQIYWMRR